MMSSLPAGWSKSIRSPSRPFAPAVTVVVVVFLLVVVVVVSRLKLLDPGGHTLPPVHLLLPHPRPPISLFTFVTFALEKTQNLSTKADSSSHRKNWGKMNWVAKPRFQWCFTQCALVGRQRRTEPMAPTVCLPRRSRRRPMLLFRRNTWSGDHSQTNWPGMVFSKGFLYSLKSCHSDWPSSAADTVPLPLVDDPLVLVPPRASNGQQTTATGSLSSST